MNKKDKILSLFDRTESILGSEMQRCDTLLTIIDDPDWAERKVMMAEEILLENPAKAREIIYANINAYTLGTYPEKCYSIGMYDKEIISHIFQNHLTENLGLFTEQELLDIL